MTKEKAVEELDVMPAHGDNEAAHARADKILVERLKELEPETAEAFERASERCDFWYA